MNSRLEIVYQGSRCWIGELKEESESRLVYTKAIEWNEVFTPTSDGRSITIASNVNVGKILHRNSTPDLIVCGACSRVPVDTFDESDRDGIVDVYEKVLGIKSKSPKMIEKSGLILPTH